MSDLAISLTKAFESLFTQTYPSGCHMKSTTLFEEEDAWQIVKNYSTVFNGGFLREILGGERLPGHFGIIHECIDLWFRSDSFKKHQKELEDLEIQNDQELLDLELVEEEHREQSRLKIAEKSLKEAEIADRKQLRQERAAENERVKAEKRARRQIELGIREEEAVERARLKEESRTIRKAEKAKKDAGIAERRRLREERKAE